MLVDVTTTIIQCIMFIYAAVAFRREEKNDGNELVQTNRNANEHCALECDQQIHFYDEPYTHHMCTQEAEGHSQSKRERERERNDGK